MQLISLITTNFKKLGCQTFNFGPGLNVISGENFQGKSTLLQAIEAALFGASALPVKAEHIATWGHSKWGLELNFIEHGQVYRIVRTGSTAKLTRHVEGEAVALVANGTTAVKAEVESLMDLAAKDYNMFIQSRQGESSGILTFGATALNRKVEEYAGIDLIEKIGVAAQLRSTRLMAKAEGAPTEEQIALAKTKLDEAEHYAAQALSAKQEADIALEMFGEFSVPEVKDLAPTMRQEVHAAELLLGQLEAAEGAVEPALQRVNEAQTRLAGRSLQDASELQKKLEQLKEAGTTARLALDQLRLDKKSYDDSAAHVERLRAAAEAAEKAVVQVVDLAALNAAMSSLAFAEKASSDAVAKAAEANSRVRSLRDLAKGAKCPTCGAAKADHDPAKLEQELADAVAEAEKLTDAKTELVDAEATARAVVRKYEQQDNEATRTLGVYERAEEDLERYSANFDTLTKVDDSQIHDAEGVYEQTRTAYAEAQAALKQIDQQNQSFNTDQAALASAQSALTAAQEKAATLDASYAALAEPPTPEAIKAATDAYTAFVQAKIDWNNKRADLSAAVTTANADLKVQEQLCTAARENHADLLADLERCADDSALAKKYDRLVRFLRDGRQGYMQQVWGTVLAVSSRIVRESSKGTITRIINDDGQFAYEEDGILVPTNGASGAQKAFIGTALRVGLSRTLYGSDSLLAFDEPTESCSEQFASALTATLAASAKQVLLITHREADQVLADHIINVGA